MGLGPVGARSPALISGPKLYFSKLESKSTEIEHKISQKKTKQVDRNQQTWEDGSFWTEGSPQGSG